MQRRGAGDHRQDGIGVTPDLGDVRREVHHAEGRPELLDHLAAVLLEGALEAADDLPAEGVVGRDDGDLAVAERLRDVLAEGMGGLARCPAGADDPAILLALRQVIRRGDGEERRELVLLDFGGHRVPDVPEQDARHELYAIVFDDLAQLRHGRVRSALTVFHDQLNLAPGHLRADLIEVHRDAVDHVFGRLRRRAGEIRDEPDLDRPRLRRRAADGPEEERDQDEQCHREAAGTHGRSS